MDANFHDAASLPRSVRSPSLFFIFSVFAPPCSPHRYARARTRCSHRADGDFPSHNVHSPLHAPRITRRESRPSSICLVCLFLGWGKCLSAAADLSSFSCSSYIARFVIHAPLAPRRYASPFLCRMQNPLAYVYTIPGLCRPLFLLNGTIHMGHLTVFCRNFLLCNPIVGLAA